jgi:nucleoside-triphosphatase
MSQGGERPHERAILLIDEIGKMECFSLRFVTAVRSLLDGRRPMVATVAIKGGGFIAEAKARPDVEIWQVTKANREELPERLAAALTARLGGK